jgi:hypothetical protein
LRRHRGNADVLRQELAIEKAIAVSLRTVERAVKPYRQELEAEARATVRFETPPGKQMQIDFGERLVEIGGAKLRVYLFVATLGYSRRSHIRAFRNERQESWFDGLRTEPDAGLTNQRCKPRRSGVSFGQAVACRRAFRSRAGGRGHHGPRA